MVDGLLVDIQFEWNPVNYWSMGQVKIGYLQFLKGNTLEISWLFAREREWPLGWMTEWRSNFGLWVGTTAPLSLSNQVLKYVDREAEEWFGYLFWFHINGLSDNIHPFWLSTHWCIDSSWLAVAPIICGNHIGQSFASSLLSSHLEQMTNLSFVIFFTTLPAAYLWETVWFSLSTEHHYYYQLK